EDDVDVICGFLFPKRRDFTPEMVDEWMQELHEVGLIVRYEVNGARYFQVVGWHEVQHPRRPQTSKIPPCPDLSDHVATSPDGQTSRDMSRQVAQERRGEERIEGGEGESEGEVPTPTENPLPVDNPLALRAAGIARRASLRALDGGKSAETAGHVQAGAVRTSGVRA